LNKAQFLLNKNGKLLILTLPRNSDYYRIMLHQVYPEFNYAEYIVNFYKKLGLKVKVEKMTMKMYVGDILSNKKLFDLKSFYRFIHNCDSYPSEKESKNFLKKIKKIAKNNYLDFKDYLVIISK
jgi:hypothetical protein